MGVHARYDDPATWNSRSCAFAAAVAPERRCRAPEGVSQEGFIIAGGAGLDPGSIAGKTAACRQLDLQTDTSPHADAHPW